jgi:hypothetical protein
MRPGLGQKFGKARDPGSLADDVEEIAMQSDSRVLPFATGSRS